MKESVYSRILLKLSGETLKGELEHGYDPESCQKAASRIKTLIDRGDQVALGCVLLVHKCRGSHGHNCSAICNRIEYQLIDIAKTLVCAVIFQSQGSCAILDSCCARVEASLLKDSFALS